jgi:rod shape-determining protein MreC
LFVQHDSRRKSYAVLLALAALALIATIYITSGERERLTPLEHVVREILAPVQTGLFRAVSWMNSVGRNLADLRFSVRENHLLRREVAALTAENVYLEEQRLENIRLRRLLDFEERIPHKTLAAEVIGRDPGNWLNTVTVNKGTGHGVRKDLAVVSCEGLLGRVVSTSRNTASVLLLIDPRSAVGGVVQRNRSLVLVEGDPGAPGMCLVKCLAMEADLMAGDKVLSSGLGGIYPKGLIIGEIVELIPGKYGVGSAARLKPAADFARLEEALIILEPSSSPDILAPGEEARKP